MPHIDDPDPAAWRDAIAQGTATLSEATDAARACRACRLWAHATQTVFGEGPSRHARLVFIGEQPGDREDLAGEPFVGPAGRLLDEAFDEALLRGPHERRLREPGDPFELRGNPRFGALETELWQFIRQDYRAPLSVAA